MIPPLQITKLVPEVESLPPAPNWRSQDQVPDPLLHDAGAPPRDLGGHSQLLDSLQGHIRPVTKSQKAMSHLKTR